MKIGERIVPDLFERPEGKAQYERFEDFCQRIEDKLSPSDLYEVLFMPEFTGNTYTDAVTICFKLMYDGLVYHAMRSVSLEMMNYARIDIIREIEHYLKFSMWQAMPLSDVSKSLIHTTHI